MNQQAEAFVGGEKVILPNNVTYGKVIAIAENGKVFVEFRQGIKLEYGQFRPEELRRAS